MRALQLQRQRQPGLELHDQRRFELQSFAVGGARMADLVREQLDPLISSGPDIAVVVVGTNDGSGSRRTGSPCS